MHAHVLYNPNSPWTGRAYDRLLVATDAQGSLTLEGFLALWVYMTFREPRKTLAYLLYLGAYAQLALDSLCMYLCRV